MEPILSASPLTSLLPGSRQLILTGQEPREF
ncbi:mCG1049253 [Mus musculus]|nr:mCG1049253 [Mus musculus]